MVWRGLYGAVLILALGGCQSMALISDIFKLPSQSRSAERSAGGDPQYGRYKVGDPYEVQGVWYYPRDYDSYAEEGVASWYGPQFHGRRTANGARFDMNKVSAAHKTLPLPSVVLVTNLENGREMKIVVNDRGPFVGDRIIDISRKGADLLGFRKQGTALVRVELLKVETARLLRRLEGGDVRSVAGASEPPLPESAQITPVEVSTLSAPETHEDESASQEASLGLVGSAEASTSQLEVGILEESVVAVSPENANANASVDANSVEAETLAGESTLVSRSEAPAWVAYVQVGAYSDYGNAQRAQALLSPLGEVVISQVEAGDQVLLRVRVGPLFDTNQAHAMLKRVQDGGYPGARIVVLP